MALPEDSRSTKFLLESGVRFSGHIQLDVLLHDNGSLPHF